MSDSMSNHPYYVPGIQSLYPEIIVLDNKKILPTVKVLDMVENVKFLLDYFKIKVRYNLMTREREIDVPNVVFFEDDKANISFEFIYNIAIRNSLPTLKLNEHLNVIASENVYHPIVECIASKPWDGIERLATFLTAIEVENPAFAYPIIHTWLTAACAAAHSMDGFVHQGVLVLQGEPKIGKTEWVKALDPLGCGAIKEGFLLDIKNKDSIAQLARHWIGEFAELEAIFKQNQQGALKAFITMQYDQLRLPYARQPIQLKRRTAYVATVNQAEFLIDQTGNRRWWVIAVKSINLNHGLDMQQVWAEIYVRWKAGMQTDLTYEQQEAVNENNAQHEEVDPLEEKLLSYFDWKRGAPYRKLTTTEVLELLGYNQPKRADTIRMSAILTKLTGKKSKKYNGKKVYEVPHL